MHKLSSRTSVVLAGRSYISPWHFLSLYHRVFVGTHHVSPATIKANHARVLLALHYGMCSVGEASSFLPLSSLDWISVLTRMIHVHVYVGKYVLVVVDCPLGGWRSGTHEAPSLSDPAE